VLFLYFLVIFLCGIPTFVHVVVAATPQDNTLALPVSSPYFTVIFNRLSAPLLMALSNTVVLPASARALTRWRTRTLGRHTAPMSISILVLVGLFFNTFVLPSVATLIFSQGCFQGIFSIWTPCSSNVDLFEQTFTVSRLWMEPKDVKILSREDICTPFQFRAGYCTREYVEWVGPFFVKKLFFYACLGPFFIFIRNTNTFRKCFPRFAYSFDPSAAVPVHFAQFEAAVVLGPFVPVLLPFGLMALGANMWAHYRALLIRPEFQVQRWLVQESTYPYLLLGPVTFSFFCCLFFWDNSSVFAGLPVCLALLGVVLVIIFGVAFVLGRRQASGASPVQLSSLNNNNSRSFRERLLTAG